MTILSDPPALLHSTLRGVEALSDCTLSVPADSRWPWPNSRRIKPKAVPTGEESQGDQPANATILLCGFTRLVEQSFIRYDVAVLGAPANQSLTLGDLEFIAGDWLIDKGFMAGERHECFRCHRRSRC